MRDVRSAIFSPLSEICLFLAAVQSSICCLLMMKAPIGWWFEAAASIRACFRMLPSTSSWATELGSLALTLSRIFWLAGITTSKNSNTSLMLLRTRCKDSKPLQRGVVLRLVCVKLGKLRDCLLTPQQPALQHHCCWLDRPAALLCSQEKVGFDAAWQKRHHLSPPAWLQGCDVFVNCSYREWRIPVTAGTNSGQNPKYQCFTSTEGST